MSELIKISTREDVNQKKLFFLWFHTMNSNEWNEIEMFNLGFITTDLSNLYIFFVSSNVKYLSIYT